MGPGFVTEPIVARRLKPCIGDSVRRGIETTREEENRRIFPLNLCEIFRNSAIHRRSMAGTNYNACQVG